MRFHAAALGVPHFSAVLLATLVALSLAAGCEVAIGDAVPSFRCEPEGDGSACPASQVCSPSGECIDACTGDGGICSLGSTCDSTSGLCVAAPADGSTDQRATDSEPDDSPSLTEGGPGRSLGSKCGGNTDCDSGFCAQQVAAPDLYAAAGNSSFCAQTCCTSGDCPGTSVCFATAAGANYCANPAWLHDRTTLEGSSGGGASCSDGTDCRSGLCTSGHCADTCCSTAQAGQCASGFVCAFGPFPGQGFDAHFSANCLAASAVGLFPDGQSCSANSDCESNLCLNDGTAMHCSNACRTSSDCASGQSCWYLLPNPGSSDVVAACYPSQGSTAVAQSCSSPPSCANDLCVSGACTDVCVIDSDCSSSLPHCILTLLPVGAGGKVEVAICQ